jgi:phenylacetic acid degradation operon negative regulatory protein
VLLTVLGEYVLPREGPVWQETVIAVLDGLGYKVHAARQAMQRSVADGWVRTERLGRRSKVHLTPETAEMLAIGARRIYGFGEPIPWNGHWLLVVVRVPEDQRDVRHQARTRLGWAGFGSLGGGLWISPHVEHESDVARVLELDRWAGGELMSFRASPGEIGDTHRLISEAWDLDKIAGAYRSFIEQFKSLRPKSPEAVFAAQTMLVHEWRRFPFLDPDLPESMLPSGWPRAAAHSLFRSRHQGWHEAAQDYFGSVEALRDAA